MFSCNEISEEKVLRYIGTLTKKQRYQYVEGWNKYVEERDNDKETGKSGFRRNSYRDEGYCDARSLVLKQQLENVSYNNIETKKL